jgi:hypothetical protein
MDPARRTPLTQTFDVDGRHVVAGKTAIHRPRQLVVMRDTSDAVDQRPVTFHIHRPDQADRPHQSPATSPPRGILALLRAWQPSGPESGGRGWLSIVTSFLSVETDDRRSLEVTSKAFRDAFARLRGCTWAQLAADRAKARRAARGLANSYADLEKQRKQIGASTVAFQQSSPRAVLRALIAEASGRRSDIEKERSSILARMMKLQLLEKKKLTGSPLQRARSRFGLALAEDPNVLQQELSDLECRDFDQLQLIRGAEMNLRQLDLELDRARDKAGRKPTVTELHRWMDARDVQPVKELVARELDDGFDAALACCSELQAKCKAGAEIKDLDALFRAIPLDDDEQATLLSVMRDPNQLHTRIEQLKRGIRQRGTYRLAALELRAMAKGDKGGDRA